MFDLENFDTAQAFVETKDEALNNGIHEAAQVRSELADANLAVQEAEAEVKAAERQVVAAKQKVRSYGEAGGNAQFHIEHAAKDVAIAVVRQRKIDPLTKTLFALVYEDSTLARAEEPDIYQRTIQRGKIALSSIMENLEPGSPILFFDTYSIVADVATKDSLKATPPTIDDKTYKGSTFLNGGSIAVSMPNGRGVKFYSSSEVEPLMPIQQLPEEVDLMTQNYRYGIDRLVAMAGNHHNLVMGKEAVTSTLKQLEPTKRFIALTALQAAGVDITARFDKEFKQYTEGQLTSLLAFLAAGTGPEMVTRPAAFPTRNRRTVTEPTEMSKLAEKMDKQSIRHIAGALGLSKNTLRARVVEQVQGRKVNDKTSLDQLAKDIQSTNNLDALLDIIFAA